MTNLAININNLGEIETMAGATHTTPVVTKISDTEYDVTGVLGIASSGWRTSIPIGDDGLPVFTVGFVAIANGVKVITSKPIPDGRVLTLRFDVQAQETEIPL